MRNYKKVILSILLCLSLLGVQNPMIFAADGETTKFCIKIVHTNDIHARVEENAKSGIIGIPKLKTLIDEYTANADMDFVLDSGDLYHGQSIATLEQGNTIAELVKACGYDAMTAGNHDWNYGKDQLKALVAKAELQMLTGNVVDSEGKAFFDTPYLIKEMEKDGKKLKVGLFGGIDDSLYGKTAAANVAGLTFTNLESYAKETAKQLKEQECDIVIALTHTSNPVNLAKQVDDVDLWLAGHEHIDIDQELTTPDGSQSYVVENGYYLYEAGLIDLDCTLDSQGDVASVYVSTEKADYEKTGGKEENTTVKDVLAGIKERQATILNELVGSSPADLDGVWENLRVDETNLGRVVTDAYLLETGADLAFENAGGIRASVKKGNVTYGDIIGVSPFGNYIVTKQVNGKQLKEILETSIGIQVKCIAAKESGKDDSWPNNSGSYLQTAGMIVTYNPSLNDGSRVISVKVGGQELEENKIYTVATNNFVAVSSLYPQLAEAEEVREYSACDEALIKFFKQSEDTISNSVQNPRMIKTTEAPSPTATPIPTAPSPTATPIPTATTTPIPTATSTVSARVEPTLSPTPASTATGADVTKTPERVKIKSAKNSKKKGIVVKLAKAKNGKKYQICYATNKKFEKAKKKTSTKLICTLKNLKKGKTYYIKARAVNGKKRGKWSKVCRVKVKK